MLLNASEVIFLDRILTVLNYHAYTDLDKEKALAALIKFDDNILEKIPLLSHLNPKDYNFVLELIFNSVLLKEYEEYKNMKYSIYSGFYKIHSLFKKHNYKHALNRLQNIWGDDFNDLQKVIKSCALYDIKNISTGWDNKEEQVEACKKYYSEYKSLYEGFSVWPEIEAIFKTSLVNLKK